MSTATPGDRQTDAAFDLAQAGETEIVSDGNATGCILPAGDGQPILLMPDRLTGGANPKLSPPTEVAPRPWTDLPRQTVHGWFAAFRDGGVWESLDHPLVMLDRERTGREAGPAATLIDSQSVKTTEAGGPRGCDAGRKIKGRKRHAMVDTDGCGLALDARPADIRDRDGAPSPIRLARGRRPIAAKEGRSLRPVSRSSEASRAR